MLTLVTLFVGDFCRSAEQKNNDKRQIGFGSSESTSTPCSLSVYRYLYNKPGTKVRPALPVGTVIFGKALGPPDEYAEGSHIDTAEPLKPESEGSASSNNNIGYLPPDNNYLPPSEDNPTKNKFSDNSYPAKLQPIYVPPLSVTSQTEGPLPFVSSTPSPFISSTPSPVIPKFVSNTNPEIPAFQLSNLKHNLPTFVTSTPNPVIQPLEQSTPNIQLPTFLSSTPAPQPIFPAASNPVFSSALSAFPNSGLPGTFSPLPNVNVFPDPTNNYRCSCENVGEKLVHPSNISPAKISFSPPLYDFPKIPISNDLIPLSPETIVSTTEKIIDNGPNSIVINNVEKIGPLPNENSIEFSFPTAKQGIPLFPSSTEIPTIVNIPYNAPPYSFYKPPKNPVSTFINIPSTTPAPTLYDIPSRTSSTIFSTPTPSITNIVSSTPARTIFNIPPPASNQLIKQKEPTNSLKPIVKYPLPTPVSNFVPQFNEQIGYSYPKPIFSFPAAPQLPQIPPSQSSVLYSNPITKFAQPLPSKIENYYYSQPQSLLPINSPAPSLPPPAPTEGYVYPKQSIQLSSASKPIEPSGYSYPKPSIPFLPPLVPSKSSPPIIPSASEDGYNYPKPKIPFSLPEKFSKPSVSNNDDGNFNSNDNLIVLKV